MSGILTTTDEETHNLGRWIANEVLEGVGSRHGATVLALTGPLGAGKTTFVQGLAEGLGVAEDLQSPTYVLVKEYEIPEVLDDQATRLVHVDAYRLERPEDLNALGFQDMLDDPNRIIVVEWAERIRPALPADALWIEFQHVSNMQRRIVVQSGAARLQRFASS